MSEVQDPAIRRVVRASGEHPHAARPPYRQRSPGLRGKTETKAEKSEVKSKTPLALDTSAAGGRIPPDLAALPLEPQSPTHIDHIAIAWAALEALPPERRRKVLARVPPASTIGCIAPDTLANAPGVDICAKRCRALAVSQMRRG